MSVEAFVNVHRPAKQTGTLGSALDIFYRFNRPQQYGGRMALAFRHHVHAVIHSVNQIHVSVARRTEHDFRSFRQSFGRMRREIVRAEVGFRFHNPANRVPRRAICEPEICPAILWRPQSCPGRKMSAAVFAWVQITPTVKGNFRLANAHPGPLPSDGRGRIFRRLPVKRKPEFTERAFKKCEIDKGCSLSLRERVRVRGNSQKSLMHNAGLLLCLYCA